MTGDILDLGWHEAHNAALLTFKDANSYSQQWCHNVCISLLERKEYPGFYRMRTLILSAVAGRRCLDDEESNELFDKAQGLWECFRETFDPLYVSVPKAAEELENIEIALDVAKDIVIYNNMKDAHDLQDLLRITPDYSISTTPVTVDKPTSVIEATKRSVQPGKARTTAGIIPIINTPELTDLWEETAKEFLKMTERHDPKIVPRMTLWMASDLQTMRKNIEGGASDN